jgi:hypothetical protein
MGIDPKRYRARFIEPGVISYDDIGMGLVMVGRNALDRMRPSFVGMPVFNFVHKEIEADEAFDFENATKETAAVGIISGVGTEDDGWDWADMMIWDEETQKNIDEKGFTVSCAYDTLESGPPGKHNGIEFDEEVLNGKYVHMAIVDNPRYEGSTVVRNAKPKGDLTMGEKTKKSWFISRRNSEPTEEEKKNAAAAEEAKKAEEAKENAEEGLQADEGAFMLIDGQKVPLQELVESYLGKQNAGGAGIAPEDEVTLPDGTKVTGADLLKAYQGNGGAQVENSEGEEVETEVASGDKKMNSAGEKEKPNANFLAVKKNAQQAAEAVAPSITTKADRYAAGKERYGSAVPAGGK